MPWQNSSAMPESTSSAVAASALCRGLAADAVTEVSRSSGVVELAAGEWLFLQGETVESLFVIESGVLRLVQHTPAGEEVVVRTLGRGEIVAGVALLEKRTYPVSAIAQTDCRILVWPRALIGELAARHPLLLSNVLGTIANRMQDSLSRIRELSTESVAQRVARALVRLVREHGRRVDEGTLIDQPLGRQELADLSGASMYTASRLLAGWSRDGILAVGRKRVVVRSMDRLEAIAGNGERSK
jgi:CRP-like cAMP-binding protein